MKEACESVPSRGHSMLKGPEVGASHYVKEERGDQYVLSRVSEGESGGR